MKANEIQISDWLYSIIDRGDHTEKKLCKVTGIRTDCDVPLIQCDDTDVWYPLDSYEPIPLTPEILEKNGFKEYNGLYRLDITEGVFVNADFKSKEPFVSVHNTCYRATPICKYLHQLQHVLRLCGIPREIII